MLGIKLGMSLFKRYCTIKSFDTLRPFFLYPGEKETSLPKWGIIRLSLQNKSLFQAYDYFINKISKFFKDLFSSFNIDIFQPFRRSKIT